MDAISKFLEQFAMQMRAEMWTMMNDFRQEQPNSTDNDKVEDDETDDTSQHRPGNQRTSDRGKWSKQGGIPNFDGTDPEG